ncbi:Uma2 family endonuclease [Thiorhodococcus minor]|uniref:Uma2 family endonuclease n=1 Tax=Thiorhodococcus minor TaxID=57489 RepID=A0A6M0K598_9GAMM|nr:Uma2 family endonuclease [Thiorhodococcus minor]NEV64471.1 Uma2 family endonuclease [Thiorhodococcus minor]
MNSPAEHIGFDAEHYLAWEEAQDEKHEYLRGEVFAMVGARRNHVVVAGNLFAAFKQRLRGGPCQAYISDLRLRVEAADAFFYPDVMVSCDARDHAATRFIEHPTLIVEVLSDSTAAFDRGDKFAAYRTLPALQEYILVDIPARRVESFRRATDPEWLFHAYPADSGECRIACLDLSVSHDEIFENASPESPEDSTEPDQSGKKSAAAASGAEGK